MGLMVAPWLGGLIEAPAEDNTYTKGLAAWRKEGFDKATCASCHGPDGLELAVYDFDDATIRRRAAIHIRPEDADSVVDLIHSVRARYGIKKLLDPMRDRPFQPGGSVLPGSTVAERDNALGQELLDRLPKLTHGRVSSLTDAVRAKNEVLALNLWDLQVGFLFNRLSEDVFHGKEHASIAAWLPDVPETIVDSNRNEWFAIEDRYLDDPSDDNLLDMLYGARRLSNQALVNAASLLAEEKFSSVLIGQHLMRKKLSGNGSPPPKELFGYRHQVLTPNPMWNLGDIARRYEGYSTLKELGFPKEVIEKKSGGPTVDQQLKEMTLPWLWLGWMTDQGLQHITTDRRLSSGQYMCQALWDEGPYPTHNALFLTKKLVTQSFVPEAWVSKVPQHFVLDYSGLLRNGKHLEYEPIDPAAKKRYQIFLANCFRMSIYLMLDEIRRKHEVWIRDSARGSVVSMAAYIDHADPSARAQTKALVSEALSLIEDATQRIP